MSSMAGQCERILRAEVQPISHHSHEDRTSERAPVMFHEILIILQNMYDDTTRQGLCQYINDLPTIFTKRDLALFAFATSCTDLDTTSASL